MSSPQPDCDALTGRGVRIAVIDSGVHGSHPHIVAGVAGGVSLGMNGERAEGEYTDRLGHGTAVMAAIQEKAPGAVYFAVKVFDTSLRTTADCLVRAIDWCVERRINLVNMSLGTLNQAHAAKFEAAVLRAAEAGCILVAAREVEGQPCLPGCLPGVYGIDLDWDCPRTLYRAERTAEGTRFRASGFPRTAPGITPERNLHGISFAVANMTGFAARAMESSGASSLALTLLLHACRE